MILSLLVYILTAVVLCVLGAHVAARDERYKVMHGEHASLPMLGSWEIWLSILIITVLLGARWHTGFDHAMYLDKYLRATNGELPPLDRFEPGFKFVTIMMAKAKIHYFFYFAIWAFLQAFFLYFGLRNRKFLLPWVGLNLMLGVYFLNWSNSMRQAIVVSLFVALVPLIVNRSWRNFIIYFLIVLLSLLIHRSAIILIPVYLLTFAAETHFGMKRRWTISILVACVALGIYPIWFKLFTFMPGLLKAIGYNIYNQDILIKDLLLNGNFRWQNFGPSRVGLLVIDVLILWYYPRVRSYFSSDKLLPMFFLLAFIGMCGENLLMNTAHYVLRPTEYFLIFVMIMNGYTITYLWRNERRLLALLYVLIMVSYAIIAVYKGVYRATPVTEPFVYQFFFLQ